MRVTQILLLDVKHCPFMRRRRGRGVFPVKGGWMGLRGTHGAISVTGTITLILLLDVKPHLFQCLLGFFIRAGRAPESKSPHIQRSVTM